MSRLKRWGYLAVLLALLATGSSAAQQQPVVGRDYKLINPPQPTDSGKKIEVLEFFWYGCIHCYHLEPPLKAWLKRKPADVEFRYVPAVFDSSWLPLTRTFYALEAMGIVTNYHEDIFNAIHRDGHRALVTDPRAMADWLGGKGVDKQKFLDTYNSLAVNGRAQRSADITNRYGVSGTPALVVNGKYLTGPSMTVNPDNSVNYERFFQALDQLIAQARKESGGK
jgi:thiol:disulfide interchange protein DsbA